MGLTADSTGLRAVDRGLILEKQSPRDRIIALAGNPNVGKSTVFNQLTGLHQHTGNWPGKTVANVQGRHTYRGRDYILVDIPGTYSLMAHSAEEEVARNFVCFGKPDGVVVVCDATCLERNLNLVLQILEVTHRVVVCVNLMDEAKKKKIQLDLPLLEKRLGVPVVGVTARSRRGMEELMERVEEVSTPRYLATPCQVAYPAAIEAAVARIQPVVAPLLEGKTDSRWAALRLLEGEKSLLRELDQALPQPVSKDPVVKQAVASSCEVLAKEGIGQQELPDRIVGSLVETAEELCQGVVTRQESRAAALDRKLDLLFTSRKTGIPIMLLLLAGILWLTITGANYPSQLLSDFLFSFQDHLTALFVSLGAPDWLHGLVVLGMYRVLAWVVSVMLPPMAIFFPLFTLLEDFGYLPRVAFNLDRCFQRACACGKQSLTMCMGFGCNAAGVVGCRIIDSPRERLIAILTNSFVPCNGRFPTLITLITIFFTAGLTQPAGSLVSTLMLTGVIVLGVGVTFGVSKLLSHTLLKGVPSSFALELPPYRRPQVGRVIVRSVFDRTLYVLGRAVVIAAPAGMVIWLMANLSVGGESLLTLCSGFLDPLGRVMGLDGVILLAFILGFPANEIVIPIMVMTYLSAGTLNQTENLSQLHQLLTAQGWTWLTALNTILFSLMHWPCSTTCLTIYKETKSVKWTLLAIGIPTAIGMTTCIGTTLIARIFGLA